MGVGSLYRFPRAQPRAVARPAFALPFQARGIAPEHFQVVVGPRVGLEDVDHHIHEIGQKPRRALVAAGAEDPELQLAPKVLHVRDDTSHLALGGAAPDHDEIGDLAEARTSSTTTSSHLSSSSNCAAWRANSRA